MLRFLFTLIVIFLFDPFLTLQTLPFKSVSFILNGDEKKTTSTIEESAVKTHHNFDSFQQEPKTVQYFSMDFVLHFVEKAKIEEAAKIPPKYVAHQNLVCFCLDLDRIESFENILQSSQEKGRRQPTEKNMVQVVLIEVSPFDSSQEWKETHKTKILLLSIEHNETPPIIWEGEGARILVDNLEDNKLACVYEKTHLTFFPFFVK